HGAQERAHGWRGSGVGAGAHGAKGGEDARVRIDALSEMPGEWRQRVRRWAELARFLRREIEGAPAPSPGDEFMIYQTVLGAWPVELLGAPPRAEALAAVLARIERWVIKAGREAKLVSSSGNPAEAYAPS